MPSGSWPELCSKLSIGSCQVSQDLQHFATRTVCPILTPWPWSNCMSQIIENKLSFKSTHSIALDSSSPSIQCLHSLSYSHCFKSLLHREQRHKHLYFCKNFQFTSQQWRIHGTNNFKPQTYSLLLAKCPFSVEVDLCCGSPQNNIIPLANISNSDFTDRIKGKQL